MNETTKGSGLLDKNIRPRPEYTEKDIAEMKQMQLYGYGKPVEYGLFGHRLYVPKVVEILANASEGNTLPICSALLKFFKIDIDITNRANVLKSGLGSLKARELKYSVLRLLGVTVTDLRTTFNYSDMDSMMLSQVYGDLVSKTHVERCLYPLRHPEDFSIKLQTALAQIKAVSPDIQPDEIFKPNRIPPFTPLMDKSTNKSRLLLEQALAVIARALTGEMNSSDLAEATGVDKRVILDLLAKGDTGPLSPHVQKLLTENREKHLKRFADMKAKKRSAPRDKRRWF